MESNGKLPWGTSVIDPLATANFFRDLAGRSEKEYAKMGYLTFNNHLKLIHVSRRTPFTFAICGSLSETPIGLETRNKQISMSKTELNRFPTYRRSGMPHFKDVDVWYDKSAVGKFNLWNLKAGVAWALNMQVRKVDVDYALHHSTLGDLSYMTRKGDRRYAPGGIVFFNGMSWRLFASWNHG